MILTKKKSIHYVSNNDLLDEIIKFKKSGVMSETLGGMLLKIATQYSSKGNFSGYTWRQDMISESVLTCVRYLKNFKPEKSTNAFAYVTQIIGNSFKLYIKDQKKHSKIKDICYKGFELYQTEEREMIHYTQKSLNYETILSFVDENVKKEDVEINTENEVLIDE